MSEEDEHRLERHQLVCFLRIPLIWLRENDETEERRSRFSSHSLFLKW
jgi:hypothetical protein